MEILALYNLCTNIIACKKNHQIFHRKKKSIPPIFLCLHYPCFDIEILFQLLYLIYTFLDFLFFDERKKIEKLHHTLQKKMSIVHKTVLSL